MAGRNRRRRRRRRGGFSLLYKLLAFFAICAAIVAAMAIFFKVDSVEVSGNSRYSAEEIISGANLHIGDNLFLINKFSAAEQITQKLPYISRVRISRKLPNTLCIEVEENAALLVVEQDGAEWLLSTGGKIVEQVSGSSADGAIRVQGITLIDPEVGHAMQLPEEQQNAKTCLLEILQALDALQAHGRCRRIQLEDAAVITMAFDDRFTVQMAWNADYRYKLECMLVVIDTKLEDNEKGTIDLTRDAVRFIPG